MEVFGVFDKFFIEVFEQQRKFLEATSVPLVKMSTSSSCTRLDLHCFVH